MRLAKNLIWVKGVLLPLPDIDGYNATRCKTWEPNTGRNAAGTTVGSILCWKYKIELKWSFLTEAQGKSLRNLCETKPDYFAVKFDYDGEYKEITAYSTDLTATGKLYAGSGYYYKSVSINLIER